MKRINYCIESFVEKFNGIIQILLLALVIFANCMVVKFQKNRDNILSFFEIIIILIVGITLELILLHIKDSSAQRKINGIGEVVRALKKREDVWRDETDLEPFFKNTKHNFFVSGIINDKLVMKYLYKFKELLDNGIEVKILLESFEELEEATKFLFGRDYNKETSLSLARYRLNNTLTYLQSLENLEDYFSSGLLEIGLSNAPFVNPSIIAYDYKKGNTFEMRRTELEKAPEMSIRFYMQGVDGPSSKLKTHPTLLINSNIMPKQYDDFVKVIENSWSYSDHIKTKRDFDSLKEAVTQHLGG